MKKFIHWFRGYLIKLIAGNCSAIVNVHTEGTAYVSEHGGWFIWSTVPNFSRTQALRCLRRGPPGPIWKLEFPDKKPDFSPAHLDAVKLLAMMRCPTCRRQVDVALEKSDQKVYCIVCLEAAMVMAPLLEVVDLKQLLAEAEMTLAS